MRLMSVKEACAQLRIGKTTAYGLIAAGRLKTLRLNRRRLVLADSVDALITECLEETQAGDHR